MTPTKKTSNSTTLLMERKVVYLPSKGSGDHDGLHVAGGTNRGIVVNKRQISQNGMA